MGSTSVFALECAQSPEPQTGGAEVCVTSVYNNSGSALDDGDVVVWDIGSSTGDDDNWVTTTTTADTYLVAGVVEGAIGVAGQGIITTRGVTNVDFGTTGLGAAGSVLCSSTTAGSAGNCGGAASGGWGAFGIVTTAVSSNSVNAYINVK